MAIKSKHRTLIKATLAALIAYGSLSSVAQAQTWGEISSVEQTMMTAPLVAALAPCVVYLTRA